MCGSAATIAAGLEFIIEESERVGLRLKLSKCELIVPAGHAEVDLGALFPHQFLFDENGNNRVIVGGGFEFLGAPIGTVAYCTQHAMERSGRAKQLLDKISELEDPQVGLRLMRACSGFCRRQ